MAIETGGTAAAAAAGGASSTEPSSEALKKTPKAAPVSKPDEEHYNKLIEEETTAYEDLRKQVNELNEIIRDRSGGREEFQQQRDSVRAKIDELTKRIDAFESEQTSLRERVVDSQKKGQTLRSQAQQLQRQLGFRTPEEIDIRVKELERDLIVKSFSVKEEKQVIQEIEKLKKSKPQLAKVAAMESDAGSLETEPARDMATRQVQVRQEMRNLRDARREYQEKLRDITQRREDTMAPLRDLVDKREELRRKMLDHDTKRRDLRSEYNDKLKNFRVFQAGIRAERVDYERAEKQRKSITDQKESILKQIENMDHVPFDHKTLLYQQMILYLKEAVENYEKATAGKLSAVDKDVPAFETATSTPAGADSSVPEGCTVLAPKANRAVDTVNRKKDKNRAKQNAKPVSKDLFHTMDTLRQFYALGLESYPKTVDDCPKVIETLQKKVDGLNEATKVAGKAIEAGRIDLEMKLKNIELKEKEFELAHPKKAGKKAVPAPTAVDRMEDW